MKRFIFRVIHILGIHKIFRLAHRRQLIILLYHGVDKKRSLGIYNYRGKFLFPETFERQIRYLKKNYALMALDEAIECLANSLSLPDYPLAVTFDDGYGNFYDCAYPIIKEYGVPSTIFLASDFIEKKTPLWTDRLEYAINMSQGQSLKSDKEKITADIALRDYLKTLPEPEKEKELEKIEKESGNFLSDFSLKRQAYAPLNFEQISEMEKNNVKFGCHTKSHPILTNIPIESAEREIKDSKNTLCEKIRNLSNVFSYPNGQKKDFNETIKNIVKKEGFRAALTTIPGFNNQSASDLYALKRFSMDRTEDFSEFLAIISGVKLFFQKIKKHAR